MLLQPLHRVWVSQSSFILDGKGFKGVRAEYVGVAFGGDGLAKLWHASSEAVDVVDDEYSFV